MNPSASFRGRQGGTRNPDGLQATALVPGSALTGSPGMTGILCASSDDVLPYLCQADVLAALGPFASLGGPLANAMCG